MKSFKLRVLLGISLPILLILLVTGIALSLPESNARFSIDHDQLVATFKNPDSQPLIVSTFQTLDGQSYPAPPELMLEEPDVLTTHSEIKQLYSQIDVLTKALQQNNLGVVADGQFYLLDIQPRQFSDLPLPFWLQTGAGMIGLLVSTLVWMSGRLTPGKIGFVLTGLAYVSTICASGLYSSRSLFISAELFNLLSIINSVTTTAFMAGMALFLANHPVRQTHAWVNPVILFVLVASSLMSALRWPNELAVSLYLPFALQLLGCIAAGIWQWRHSRKTPESRVILRWVLLFLCATLIPALLKQLAPEIPQAVLLSSFAVIYAGILFAVVQHDFFEMERWSYTLWSWLLGGLAVLITDVILASLIAASSGVTLSLSLAIIGWMYFPARQFFWQRLFERPSHQLEQWLARSLPELLQIQEEEYPQQRLIKALQAVFDPLDVRLTKSSDQTPKLIDQGHGLHIPLDNSQTLQLLHPAQGRRLFEKQDLRTANLVFDLNQLIEQNLKARSEGAQDERNRIRQDLHDDLGARLLRLLYRSPPDERPLVRETIASLRNLINQQEQGIQPLPLLLDRWRQEARLRCGDLGLTLIWSQPEELTRATDITLDSWQAEQIEQSLRETVSNALRNHLTPELKIEIQWQPTTEEQHQLLIQVSNDSQPHKRTDEQTVEPRLGLAGIKQRLSKAGGNAHIQENEQQDGRALWQVSLTVPVNTLRSVSL